MDRLSWTQVLVPGGYVFLLGVVAIFAHSGLQGDNGLATLQDAREETRRLEAELSVLTAQREVMQNKVERLSAKYLDLELLDERARDILGLVRDDELIVR